MIETPDNPPFELFNEDGSMNCPSRQELREKLTEVQAQHLPIHTRRLVNAMEAQIYSASKGRRAYMYDDLLSWERKENKHD